MKTRKPALLAAFAIFLAAGVPTPASTPASASRNADARAARTRAGDSRPADTAAVAEARSGAACAPIDKAGVATLFDQWNLALASLDPDAVAQRYWGDAVLLPTVSNTPRTTPAMVRDYFVHFLEKHPRGRIDSRSIQIGCNLAIDMGTYTFSVLGATGAPGEVAARYTYVYAFRDGEWKILHHHSSAMPEVLAAPATTATAQAGGAANGHDEAQTAKPEATAGDRKTRLASAEPKREPPPLDRTRMFLNTEASPQVMEYYPAEARARRETGRVALHVCADPDGKLVGEPKVVKSSGSERLDGAARQWAQAARWVPATANRRTVEGCTEITAQFRP